MVEWVTSRWQVVHLNRRTVVPRHLRALGRLALSVDVRDVLDLLLDVLVDIEGGGEPDPDTWDSGGILKGHVREEGRD